MTPEEAARQLQRVAADLRRPLIMGRVVATVGKHVRAVEPVKSGELRAKTVDRVDSPTQGRIHAGAPHSRIVHEGRGPIVAGPGRMLRFEINGQVLFRKRVGPAKANPFMVIGLDRAMPEVRRDLEDIGNGLLRFG